MITPVADSRAFPPHTARPIASQAATRAYPRETARGSLADRFPSGPASRWTAPRIG